MMDFVTNGICLKTRRIFLYGDIEEELVGKVIRALYAMTTIDPDKPITIFLSSYGGSMDESMGLVDTIRMLSCPVRCIVLGKCMSAAPLIVAACEPGMRFSMPHTSFMLHDVSQDVGGGSPAYLESISKAGKHIIKEYATLLGRWTEREAGHWKRMFNSKSDRFFTAEEAWDWGLIDAIFEEEEEEDDG